MILIHDATVPASGMGPVVADDALDEAFGAIQPIGYYRADAAWCPSVGGATQWFNRSNPRQRYAAPSSLNTPTLVANALNGKPALRFSGATANKQYLVCAGAGMEFPTANGYLAILAQQTSNAAGRTSYIVSNTTLTQATDLPPSFSMSLSGAIVYARMHKGDANTRLSDNPVTDLGVAAFHTLLWTWGLTDAGAADQIRLYIDGAEQSLNAVDTGVLTSGVHEFGRRGGVGCDMDVAWYSYGALNLSNAAHAEKRLAMFAASQAIYGV